MLPSNSGQTQFQRVALPNAELLEEEPLYVNAKQYRRILKRRQARAKLEAEGKIPKERPVCIFLFVCRIFLWVLINNKNVTFLNYISINFIQKRSLDITCNYYSKISFSLNRILLQN